MHSIFSNTNVKLELSYGIIVYTNANLQMNIMNKLQYHVFYEIPADMTYKYMDGIVMKSQTNCQSIFFVL